ncbi:hypothetical protein ES288_D07G146400v1 [Gossypium darwinii]|uniref:Uncharacterized protein n=1 Tax=Gossypium darwinii TaxID=34276 RepID=A0A5D2BVP2_GOSDA|nr:hypothetical protein ES288_D07G146400v1 [Gossypium darwinii]
MLCETFVQYSVLLNDGEFGPIMSKGGFYKETRFHLISISYVMGGYLSCFERQKIVVIYMGFLGIPIDSLCPHCGGVESIESILLKCPITLDAWRVLRPVETASNDVFLRSVLSMAADVTSFTIVSAADHFLQDGKEARNVLARVQQATARTIVHDQH